MKTPPGRSRLVGRGRELGVLRDELGRATAGEFRSVALVGEPGVGKTRLAGEVLARYGAASIVLSARGHALGETASFGLWGEAFENHLRGLSPTGVARPPFRPKMELGLGAEGVARRGQNWLEPQLMLGLEQRATTKGGFSL